MIQQCVNLRSQFSRPITIELTWVNNGSMRWSYLGSTCLVIGQTGRSASVARISGPYHYVASELWNCLQHFCAKPHTKASTVNTCLYRKYQTGIYIQTYQFSTQGLLGKGLGASCKKNSAVCPFTNTLFDQLDWFLFFGLKGLGLDWLKKNRRRTDCLMSSSESSRVHDVPHPL